MTLPDWLEPLPDAERMRATDAWAIEERGVPSLELMERAGAGLARLVADVAPEGRVVVVCGKGNNGGDGYVAARLLREEGREVGVVALAPVDELSGDARANAVRLPGPPPVAWDAGHLEGAAAVVDAVLGTGFSGEARDPARTAIAAMNAAGAPVVAADVPSGVDASTGEVEGEAVRAVATATFHRAKPGLWIAPGKTHAGRVEVVEIGIPDGAPVEADIGLLTAGALGGIPHREAGSTKFSSGNVVVVGGSRGLTGAPSMTALGAMRAGAGYVTVAGPGSSEISFAARLLEAMFVGLPEDDGALSADAAGAALEAATRADAVVVGPGLSRRPGAQSVARDVAAWLEAPLVIDADGLNALAGAGEDVLPERGAPTVLTPHAGELSRLLDVGSADVNAHRLASARDAAGRTGAVVVLKGDDTLVVTPDGRVAVSPGDAPGLATAGTGDVLAGVVGALLAKHLDPFHAACAAVWAHRVAGRLAAAPHGPDTVVASDVVAALPAALAGQ